jgi:hypothetical protein
MIDSNEGTIYRKLFEGNMDNSSYKNIKTALQDMLDIPNEVHLRSYQWILSFKEFDCQIIPVWVGKYPIATTSMAVTKNSPLRIFMKTKLFKMTEMGQLHQLVTGFKLKDPVCTPTIKVRSMIIIVYGSI